MHGMWQQLLPYLINDATDNEEVLSSIKIQFVSLTKQIGFNKIKEMDVGDMSTDELK
jgi:hypothetical protein